MYFNAIDQIDTYKRYGKVHRVVGLMIESTGPEVSVGDVCYVHTLGQKKKRILSEVVGFYNEKVLLMPYDSLKEIGAGSFVESTGQSLKVKVGRGLIGKVIDSLGNPLDHSALPKGLTTYPTEQSPPNPLERPPIREAIQVGVRAIDTLLTVGKGQRIGIFAGSGVGKSTLLGMISRNSNADINVIALIGERGREVREFIETDLGEEGLKKSIVIVATSDQPALMRIKGAYTATAISEYFRDLGFQVNLLMDSVTRVAMAQREVGLATGEPPTTKGYTPSVFANLPKLLERTGTSKYGSITAFYTVLVDGDDLNEPIADTVRGILDGHFVLDRKLAEQGQFPAINILKSISRVMPHITSDHDINAAQRIRSLLATYEENVELIQIGAYKQGTRRDVDESIRYHPKIINFLKQSVQEIATRDASLKELHSLAFGSDD
ncbi:flagellar protein export ATPase FliI [Aquibacillus sp. 3ASR75-11]|uniref:Flagellar protein export ATPase FliI n=2 Tax=Terrihalobacillus insolitus TaxID=2950438 RepID=A0A9X4AMK0_9BACI|nr:flagellar protein export ATPase FliI [Terrihalobacillus insolitus]MDC3414137.1 flagellar protein export ATPase FliI [Terrihalobacillus insolitus]MDC3423578.1 flagellar protein export ATPase FliI [Terrihalobacillus insolitus]